MDSVVAFALRADNYHPQTKFAKVMFLQVSVCPHRGGVHGFIWGHAWFYSGGVCGFIWGSCMVLFKGMCGFIRGACVVLFGGHAWFIQGGHLWFFWGGMHGFFSFVGYNEIRSMSGRYASYCNAFLLAITIILAPFKNPFLTP